MTKSVWVILVQEGMPRTNVILDTQSRDPNRLSAVRKVPGSFAGIDKHCKNKVQRGGPKISKEKVVTTALKALQQTFWLH